MQFEVGPNFQCRPSNTLIGFREELIVGPRQESALPTIFHTASVTRSVNLHVVFRTLDGRLRRLTAAGRPHEVLSVLIHTYISGRQVSVTLRLVPVEKFAGCKIVLFACL